ncbi:MAG: hypothetical protein PHP69_03800 [Candidatus Omnitrophica bacterium]|nr:hypothetical protein [Candidatus Omnitrophota bacterium]MDD5080579.1 hypothetical protein [Candidatus Omnitrophota bacterium]
MMTIIVSILTVLSTMLSAFLSFAPGYTGIVNNDFLRKSYNNAINYGLKYGQLSLRAGTLSLDDPSLPSEKKLSISLRERSDDGVIWSGASSVKTDISLVKDSDDNVVVNVKAVRIFACQENPDK